ncbi:GumC domain-containing protein [Chitinophaga tropicalis]|uniref:Lipopolysaccharide biosynthesis protein n=1 Tax=Chitinophaga tropicalis TaxID=2683588 RepID=A0A7K1TZB7_9BACT|nr:lipopolysaccharide biosynthesis protein [Chitinophaga tropicalis]MVT07433.1 lipopolysaccharide biosynthesis protein [Chitinophaga tropicalis]
MPDISQKEEISLKDLILTIQGWWKYLLSKWLIVVIMGLVGAGLGILYSVTQKPKYVGELTFVMEESKSNPLGSYAGLASQFGLDLGGAGGIGVFSGDNIMEFLRSRLMVEKTLLSGVTVNGKTESLADLYIATYNLRDQWKKDAGTASISFAYNKDRAEFSRVQDSILNILYTLIIKKNLTVTKPDKKLSFLSVNITSENEVFSKIFAERLVKEALDFYISTKTRRSKQNVDVLQAKADSIERLLNRKTYSAAAQQDLNQNPVRNMATVGAEVVSRDKMILQTVYGEVLKNLELSKLTMAQETPVIQIVDTPIYPLKRERFGKLKGIVSGGFLGGFLCAIFLIGISLYRNIMR